MTMVYKTEAYEKGQFEMMNLKLKPTEKPSLLRLENEVGANFQQNLKYRTHYSPCF